MTEKQKQQLDKTFEIIKKKICCGFSGKIVLNLNLGGITRVEETNSYEL